MGDGQVSFSQKYGYEEIPEQLKLGELPEAARTGIWNLFFHSLKASSVSGRHTFRRQIGGPWLRICRSIHVDFDNLPLDEFDTDLEQIRIGLRARIETEPFFKVFDLIEFVLSRRECPPNFVVAMEYVFKCSRLAYTLAVGPPPTIVQNATPEEGAAIVESLAVLRQVGLDGSATHLRKASAYINQGKWADSVRESIHAVESVARRLDPDAAQTLGPALKSIDRCQPLHPALKQGFASLYGYTADEQGIRHALLDQTDAKVDQDEAVFMLGACACFASYLTRRHLAGVKS